jgi:transposase
MASQTSVAEDVRVVSGYEAGRDGFWLHRFLDAQGIEVPGKKRRAKTDRLGLAGLMGLLARLGGSPGSWRG